MAIVQLKRDETDLDKVHIYSHFKNMRQWHLACLHVDELDELFEIPHKPFNEYNSVSEALFEKEELWVSFHPKIEEDM